MALASLSIRKIDGDVYERLKVRATKHGVSMEEEVRQILKNTVEAPERLGDLALEYFGQDNGLELETPIRKSHEPIDFSE